MRARLVSSASRFLAAHREQTLPCRPRVMGCTRRRGACASRSSTTAERARCPCSAAVARPSACPRRVAHQASRAMAMEAANRRSLPRVARARSPCPATRTVCRLGSRPAVSARSRMARAVARGPFPHARRGRWSSPVRAPAETSRRAGRRRTETFHPRARRSTWTQRTWVCPMGPRAGLTPPSGPPSPPPARPTPPSLLSRRGPTPRA